MILFVDTSALYAGLDAGDKDHSAAKQVWTKLLQGNDTPLATNYILVETFALVQSRLGIGAVRALREAILPFLDVRWVDESLHNAGLSVLTGLGRRKISFVDCVSFEVMRRLGIRKAFAFDRHFHEQGFELVGP